MPSKLVLARINIFADPIRNSLQLRASLTEPNSLTISINFIDPTRRRFGFCNRCSSNKATRKNHSKRTKCRQNDF